MLGVLRMAHLRHTGGLRACVGADLILLSELVLQGDFVHAPSALWQRREPRGLESQPVRLKRYTSSDYGLTTSILDRVLPLARLPIQLARVVLRSRRPILERLAMLAALLASFPIRYLAGRR